MYFREGFFTMYTIAVKLIYEYKRMSYTRLPFFIIK